MGYLLIGRNKNKGDDSRYVLLYQDIWEIIPKITAAAYFMYMSTNLTAVRLVSHLWEYKAITTFNSLSVLNVMVLCS